MAQNQVVVTPLSDSGYVSQVYAGLFELAARGEIDMRYGTAGRIREREWGSKENKRIAYLELYSGEDHIKICYDLLDGPEIVSLEGLDRCDYYFKRSYSKAYIDSESDSWEREHPEWRAKLRPFGLNFPCGTAQRTERLRYYLALNRTAGTFQRNRRQALLDTLQNGVATRRKWRPFRCIPPDSATEPLVLFQTRIWDPLTHVFSKEIEELNRYRVEVLKALRGTFEKRFTRRVDPRCLRPGQSAGSAHHSPRRAQALPEAGEKGPSGCLHPRDTTVHRLQTAGIPRHVTMHRQ